MEIHLLLIVWFSTMFLTVFSYTINRGYAFLLLAAVGWMVIGWSLGEVAIYGFDTMGNAHPYYLNAGDPHTAGMLGALYWFWGVGIIFFLSLASYILRGVPVGDEKTNELGKS